MHGVLVIDKPDGPTSHDVVAYVRRGLGIRRVGHLGTLDPFATGVLPLALGRATRLSRFLGGPKAYDATIRLGLATNTYDRTGVPVGPACSHSLPLPDAERLREALAAFRGTFWQQPPPFSAKKVEGIRSYRLARRNVIAELAPTTVAVTAIELVDFSGDFARIHIVCSPGTYIRSIAHDLGRAVGCGAHLYELRRVQRGSFTLRHAVTLDRLESGWELAEKHVIPIVDLVAGFPFVTLSAEETRQVLHGQRVPGRPAWRDLRPLDGPLRLLDETGRLLAVADAGDAEAFQSLVVLADVVR